LSYRQTISYCYCYCTWQLEGGGRDSSAHEIRCPSRKGKETRSRSNVSRSDDALRSDEHKQTQKKKNRSERRKVESIRSGGPVSHFFITFRLSSFFLETRAIGYDTEYFTYARNSSRRIPRTGENRRKRESKRTGSSSSSSIHELLLYKSQSFSPLLLLLVLLFFSFLILKRNQ